MINTVEGSENQLCWGVDCYSTGSATIYQTAATQTIQPQETNNSFIAYYLPKGNMGITTIEYWIENTNSFGDKVTFTIHYDATVPSAIEELEQQTISLEGARPNPANDLVSFTYNIKGQGEAELILVNAIGEEVVRMPVDPSGNVAMLDVSKYDSGIYYYQIRSTNGSVSPTQKLVITH